MGGKKSSIARVIRYLVYRGKRDRRETIPIRNNPMIKVNGSILDVYDVIRGEFTDRV